MRGGAAAMRRALALLALLAAPAMAQNDPRFCPNRPDLGASACTTEPGRMLVEMSGVDWTRDDGPDSREDTVLAADLLVRFGVDPSTELQVSWTPYGQVRTRDKASGATGVTRGVGDVRLGVRRHVLGPNGDGEGVALALEPFVTLPVGRAPIGEADWSAGLVLPISYDLADAWGLSFTGEAAATPDDAGRHHLALGATLGLGRDLSDTVSAVAEISLNREGGPATTRTEWVTALSVGWQPRSGLQLDVLAVAGLNRAAPDVQVQVGGAILF